ncbi:hypothetical protein FEM48_Zijuj09G0175900 [Ziziphus jujuba var. spinosa]|uniref:Amidase domain-containing protein n=1 Tax=Ziziphus jujuba var. spinosa TaxID=714518 RepID=A0A978UUD0_ZIZJJ|nr:hypothetical protein FEM48_Zijuj09G0175900 [Ziziphus jujuba var. spinosa]
MATKTSQRFHLRLILLVLTILSKSQTISLVGGFSIREATLDDLHLAFRQNQLTSRKLVEFYIREINRLNPILNAVIEVNPDALYLADKADKERKANFPGSRSKLHGIPILVKDLIGTKDKLNTTAGSFALLGSVVPRDAGVVSKLRNAGAIILGKASMTEWASLRSLNIPLGWSARGGQGKNPYLLSATPCGSSSGSAISVAANLVSVSLGTETDGSLLCPASYNSVVGIKPTVGLTSRAGVIPFSPRQDTIGPIGRTVSDAVSVLDAIVGLDYIPQAFENHFQTLREKGAILIDNLEIANIYEILNITASGEATAILAEFKLYLNQYLKKLVVSPVRSLADVIAFNQRYPDLELTEEYGQEVFLAAQATNGIGDMEKAAILNLETLSREGFEKLVTEKNLDALVSPGPDVSPVLAIGGFPGINVPAGYDDDGVPFGINFGGLKGSESKLIEVAYSFEQATKVRKQPPTLQP